MTKTRIFKIENLSVDENGDTVKRLSGYITNPADAEVYSRFPDFVVTEETREETEPSPAA